MTMRSIRAALGSTAGAQAAYRGAVRARMGAERWGLAATHRTAGRRVRRGRILAYHSVGTPEWGVNDVSPADFERHLQLAVDDGWTFATPAEVLAEPDQPRLALTFDDGVRSVLTNAVPVLRHHGVPATMFVVTGWADGGHPDGFAHVLDWREVEAAQDAGLTIGSHAVTHPDFGRLDHDQAVRELVDSRERLRQMLGLDSTEFAIPYGQSGNWSDFAGRAAVEAGYTTVYAQSVDKRPADTVARTFVTRIDRPVLFRAALAGAYDNWEEWY
jgi:peptidoglycan/xylan/chitin deacetylase (PgdA/CDA1 family)